MEGCGKRGSKWMPFPTLGPAYPVAHGAAQRGQCTTKKASHKPSFLTLNVEVDALIESAQKSSTRASRVLQTSSRLQPVANSPPTMMQDRSANNTHGVHGRRHVGLTTHVIQGNKLTEYIVSKAKASFSTLRARDMSFHLKSWQRLLLCGLLQRSQPLFHANLRIVTQCNAIGIDCRRCEPHLL